ncbi:uncharacterized protein LOC113291157 [Papaver somniferum]|uniref:uncharacterized protein LOC113291157 n=1 Tax=Papaver somniferum TaxID=3469 RepID=UPI000E6FB2CF|nr:uncharacterized protein LOC113291157 [Papaver somniferum]
MEGGSRVVRPPKFRRPPGWPEKKRLCVEDLVQEAYRNTEQLNLLLSKLVEVNSQGDAGTPLIWAAGHGQPDAVKILLEHYANPNAETDDGITSLLCAVAAGALPCWKLLVKATLKVKKKSQAQEAKKLSRETIFMAVDAYKQAINPSDASLFSNRSLFYIRFGQLEHALTDAKACKELSPDWHKARYREDAASHLLQRFEEAENAFYVGVQLDPDSKELPIAFREAVDAGRKFHVVNHQKS